MTGPGIKFGISWPIRKRDEQPIGKNSTAESGIKPGIFQSIKSKKIFNQLAMSIL